MGLSALRRAVSWVRNRGEEVIDDDDVESMRAWSITARLAALPPGCELQVPAEVADLIRQARDLHPKMAAGAERRASQMQ